MIRVVAGTYEGLLYGWECPTVAAGESTKMKLTFGYAAHSECIKSVALMAAKQGKTLLSGSGDEIIKCVWLQCCNTAMLRATLQ
jgi:protein MAK11